MGDEDFAAAIWIVASKSFADWRHRQNQAQVA
jgi:hypothetical protein